MKLLILTCSTGGGHTSAAKAIAQAAGKAGAECRIEDALQFLPGFDGKVISHGHTFVYRYLPSLFGMGYRYEQRSGANVFRVECSRGARALGLYIADGGYDAVISAHIFASFMLAKLREKGELSIPTANVATDYTCSPGFAECRLDLNFIPMDLTEEFVGCGLERGGIFETGIPVSAEFAERTPQKLARAVLGLPEEGPLVLLMCGSMGCGPMEELAAALSEAMPEDGTVAVLCGTNTRLYEAISRSGLGNVKAVGYTRQVSVWMDAADLMISKPGGSTSTETMSKRLPMIIIDAVPGCETKNLQYLTGRGCAVSVPNEEIPLLASRLLNEPGRADGMKANMERYFPHGAAERICREVMGLN